MSDYSYTPREKPSVFLRLKHKGAQVQLRIGSAPYREPKIWKSDDSQTPPMSVENMLNLTEDQWARVYRDPQYNPAEVFHFKVIDRTDGQAKIFTGSPMIYKAIKKYADTAGWGDPKTYDILIERTENPGNYYEVTALPDKSPMVDSELAQLEAINMREKVPAARSLAETQVDHISTIDGPREPLPPIDTVPKQVDDVVIENFDDKPINLDDIPF